ncbi:MAG: anti-sigma factor [Croceitalea sp.]|nr:anti-sigma factor [Croceitalea sp.]
MEIENYISSGILELYVAGALSPEENLEVQHYALKHPEVEKEIEAIEGAMLQLTAAASAGIPPSGFDGIRDELDDVIVFKPSASEKRTNWATYLGWAASLILAVGLLWVYRENDSLKTEIEVSQQEKENLEQQIIEARSEVADTENILNQLRDQNVTVVALGGQTVSPTSYAKVYWNTEVNKVLIDAQGLPEPPPGYTYQVWSLKLNPLTPTSVGLLDDFVSNEKRVFELPNENESEAFGITLEPEGGSESPTLEQLYTLGVVGP